MQCFISLALHLFFPSSILISAAASSSRTPTTTRWSSPWPAGTAARSSGRSAWSITPSSGSSRSPNPNPSPSCSPEDPRSGSGKGSEGGRRRYNVWVRLFNFSVLSPAAVGPRSRSSITRKTLSSRRFHLKGEAHRRVIGFSGLVARGLTSSATFSVFRKHSKILSNSSMTPQSSSFRSQVPKEVIHRQMLYPYFPRSLTCCAHFQALCVFYLSVAERHVCPVSRPARLGQTGPSS